jgi:hypothetical protein
MRISAVIALILLYSIAPREAQAQADVKKSEGEFFEQTAGGELVMCGLEFSVVYSDRTYLRGGISTVSGSLAWFVSQGNLGLGMKINGQDFPGAAVMDMTPRRFRPSTALLSVDDKLQPNLTRTQCEDPLAYCGTYWGQPAAEVIKALYKSKVVSISLNREVNGLDLAIPLATLSTDPKMQETVGSFQSCIKTIVSR